MRASTVNLASYYAVKTKVGVAGRALMACFFEGDVEVVVDVVYTHYLVAPD